MAKALGVTLSRREAIRRASQQFQVDHRDGNHNNNNPANLQTLTHRAHKFKTDVMGDSNGYRNNNRKADKNGM
jgi:5-methylcytosine-specific restriction endonuclease McrA